MQIKNKIKAVSDMRKRPLVLIGLVFFLTLIAFNYVSMTVIIITDAAAFAGGIVFVLFRRLRNYPETAMTLFAISVAALMFFGYTKLLVLPAQNLDGVKAQVTGRIVDEIESDNGRYTYIIKTEKINAPGVPQKVKVRVTTYSKLYADVYDKITTDIKFNAISDDYKFSSYSSSVFISGFISGGTQTAVESDGYKTPYYYALMLRRHLHAKIYEYLPENEASVVSAVTLNISDGISEDIKEDFRDSGISHLLAVSGQHMGVIVQFSFMLLSRILTKRKSALITLVPLVIFMAVTGFSPSVIRAGIMNIIYLLGLALSRRADSLNSLSVAVMIMCIINPYNSVNVSLQLSAFATLGLIILSRPINRYLRRHFLPRRRLFRRILGPVYSSASASLAATLFLLPVSVLQFGYISVVGVITNLLVLYVSLGMLCLAVSVLVISFIPFTAFIVCPCMLITGLFAKFIIFIAHIMSSLPFASVPTTYRFVYLWLAGVMILTALAVLLHRRGEVIKITAAMAVFSLLAGVVSYSAAYKDVIQIGVISAGSGQMVVMSSEGKTVLIGCGGDGSASYNLRDYLRRRGIKEIDTVILPDYSSYFSAAAPEILSETDVNILLCPQDTDGTSPVSVLSIDKTERITLTGCDRVDLFNNVYAILESDRGLITLYIGETVLEIAAPNAHPQDIPADILICGASPPQDIEAYKDRTVIIGTSEDNEDKVFGNMKAAGVDAYSTVDGDVILQISQNGGYNVKRGM